MNRTKIEWCDYTWNPLVGCKYNCSYCYARRLNHRFNYIHDWNEPQFFPERLEDPSKIKKPSRIFVVSMGDLFGPWVSLNWIKDVIKVCKQNPQHTFMFLTKNEMGYMRFKFPSNCMLGLTITKPNQEKIRDFIYLSRGRRFLSIEPILGDFSGIRIDSKEIELVIIGAMTGPGAVDPAQEWISSINHHNLFFKDSIKKLISLSEPPPCKIKDPGCVYHACMSDNCQKLVVKSNEDAEQWGPGKCEKPKN